MSEDSTKVSTTTHKEETKSRIEKDMADRLSLRETLKGYIDPLEPDTHPNGQLINICSGHIATEHINVWNAVAIGTKQMGEFEKSWPEGFTTVFQRKFSHLPLRKACKIRQ